MERVKDALQKGVDVNTKYVQCTMDSMYTKWTGLMFAVYKNHNSVVELLLRTPNIDVNLKDDSGRCALHLAVKRNNTEALTLLLNVPNINVNIVTKGGETALHLAAKSSEKIEALKLLLNVSNIDVNSVNNFGQTALHWAVKCNNVEALKLLLNISNIDVNSVNNHGQTALHWALYRLEPLKLLVADPRVDVEGMGELYIWWVFLVESCFVSIFSVV